MKGELNQQNQKDSRVYDHDHLHKKEEQRVLWGDARKAVFCGIWSLLQGMLEQHLHQDSTTNYEV